MLWLGVILLAGSGLAQEDGSAEVPERSAEEQAQREELERVRAAYEEAYWRGEYEEAARSCARQPLLPERSAAAKAGGSGCVGSASPTISNRRNCLPTF